MSYFLGIEVKQNKEEIFISQEAYAKQIVKRFKMEDCNLSSISVDYDIKLSKNDESGWNSLWELDWKLKIFDMIEYFIWCSIDEPIDGRD